MSKFSTSIAIHYHERTKYHPETIATKSRGLDWSKQPSVFKEYKIGNSYDLKTYLSDKSIENEQTQTWRRLSYFLASSYGLIELAAAINHYRPHLIGGFFDHIINELLYLDPEQEAAITIISLKDLLAPQQNPLHYFKTTALPSEIQTDYPNIDDGKLLHYFHQATEIEPRETFPDATLNDDSSNLEDKYNFPFCLKISTKTKPINWGENLQDLQETIFKRRSTRSYTGSNLSLEELKFLLNFTYQPQNYEEIGLDSDPDYFDLSLIETFIAVSGVNGLEEGCYYYAPKAQELRQIRFKNFRRELHYLCLGQDLGRDAGVLIFHTADLQKGVNKYGDRVYRYLHLDAGHLGQRLNLAAIQLNLGVSGIGGFFDDQVNEVLGIPNDEAVLYITTLGRPR
ncbi:MAG TPA: SagB-type dehydrogenase domain-containing protein [Cyanothece sp. UBA12306]|nr:SagB-type dehydrogenase domain-containing protein [Cyanothece sp. UBA12306]